MIDRHQRLTYVLELLDEASKIATEEKADVLLYLLDQSKIEAQYLLDGGNRESISAPQKPS